MEGIPTLLGGYSTPNDENGKDSTTNGQIQSQKLLVGFGLDGEIVVWDHGDGVLEWEG